MISPKSQSKETNNAMKTLSEMFRGKKAVLLGAGVSNTPLASFLSSLGAKVEVRDKKTREALGAAADSFDKAGASLVLGEGYLENMRADYIFRSPGFRPDMKELRDAAERGAEITSEMEFFMKVRPAFTFGVTGSDGKSTTTTVIYKMLCEKFAGSEHKIFLGGNIGYPLLHRVGEMDEKSFVSVELSSFQLMTIDTPPDVAVITNVSPNHLNWHTGMDEYIAAKAKILSGAKRAVLNFKNEVTRELGRGCLCPVTYFTRETPTDDELKEICEKDGIIYVSGEDIVYRKSGAKGETHVTHVMKLSDILIPGMHNAENYMAACAAVYGIVETEYSLKVAREFGGVKHRLELIRIKDGVYYYNSSIDSSPTRTAAAISAITDKPINIICGGYDKKIPFEPLARAIYDAPNIKSVTLTGATAEKISAVLEKEKEKRKESGKESGKESEKREIPVHIEADFKEAVLYASRRAQSGDAVLLSPACASFDAFENFERRGDFFRDTVNNDI